MSEREWPPSDQKHDRRVVREAPSADQVYGAKRERPFSVLGMDLAGPAETVAAIREGLPVSALDRLQEGLGVPAPVMSRAVNIKERTLARRTGEARLKSDESERVLRIGMLLDRSVEVLGGLAQARGWLQAPNTALGGATPLDFADTEPGAREVEAVLGRIEYGIFS